MPRDIRDRHRRCPRRGLAGRRHVRAGDERRRSTPGLSAARAVRDRPPCSRSCGYNSRTRWANRLNIAGAPGVPTTSPSTRMRTASIRRRAQTRVVSASGGQRSRGTNKRNRGQKVGHP